MAIDGTLRCATDDECEIYYNRDYTPLLLDVSANVYAGGRVTMHTYMKSTNNAVEDSAMPFTQFKLGSMNIDTEDIIDEDYTFSNWVPSSFYGIVNDQIAASSIEPIIRF